MNCVNNLHTYTHYNIYGHTLARERAPSTLKLSSFNLIITNRINKKQQKSLISFHTHTHTLSLVDKKDGISNK